MISPTDEQLGALERIVKIGTEKAASTLSGMLDSHVEMKAPFIVVFNPERPGEDMEDLQSSIIASVQRNFHGSFSGSSLLVFPPESAVKLVAALTDEKPGSDGFDAVMADTLSEVGNILINSLMGSINNVLSAHIDYSPPKFMKGRFADLLKPPGSNQYERFLLIRINFEVHDPKVKGDIVVIFELDSAGDLFTAIDNL